MNTTAPDLTVLEQAIQWLPADRVAELLLTLNAGELVTEQLQFALAVAPEAIDWDAHRDQVGQLLNQLLPLEMLVPDLYAAWRPVVHDAVAYIGAHLSPARLAPKLVEQLLLPADTALEKRVTAMIARMPSLQKIGQIVARYPKLDPAFRHELIQLENAIQDVTPESVHSAIVNELGTRLARYRVKVAPGVVAEASVSAVVRFSWLNPANGQRELGIFKVLKPYIPDYFDEDLAILQGLAVYFDTHRAQYQLPSVNLGQFFADIRALLAQEVDLQREQAKLLQAFVQYAPLAKVRVPSVIQELCTPMLTAMSDEGGIKITEAFAATRARRRATARRLIEALIAYPLFLPEDEVLIHADPHAGNLFVNETTGNLLLFDWALAQPVSQADRRQMVRLLLGVMLRDPELIMQAVSALSRDDGLRDPGQVQSLVAEFLVRLSPWTMAGLEDTTRLITELMTAGVRFSPFLVIFRKLLFTLEGVLEDVSPEVKLNEVVVGYIRDQLVAHFYGSLTSRRWTLFALPLNDADWAEIGVSAWCYPPRLWGQLAGAG